MSEVFDERMAIKMSLIAIEKEKMRLDDRRKEMIERLREMDEEDAKVVMEQVKEEVRPTITPKEIAESVYQIILTLNGGEAVLLDDVFNVLTEQYKGVDQASLRDSLLNVLTKDKRIKKARRGFYHIKG
ncbi:MULTISPECIES: hypothetical protein [Bacillus cereus group]|uniref:Uncharacterized protein n=1 Tax=Bacillus thuringiensis TaxID=1428 RepID=A0A9X7AS49_BACTU|nr:MULTISPECIES: hypothetical protein [Bacillus cereus group]EKS7858109.1 hypothetical protein [Bacillus cereus]MDM5370503.1 hypothetical protein [Bacillus bombysepticus]PFT50749.1 hypothetical protein COK72_01740 [Bacillus thuringiensis]PFY22786.1 hypothetical protein COL44_18060 [Bacillus toyonensis]HDR4373592.1 hypothetical protein [Bacillus cereus]